MECFLSFSSPKTMSTRLSMFLLLEVGERKRLVSCSWFLTSQWIGPDGPFSSHSIPPWQGGELPTGHSWVLHPELLDAGPKSSPHSCVLVFISCYICLVSCPKTLCCLSSKRYPQPKWRDKAPKASLVIRILKAQNPTSASPCPGQ